MSETLYKKSWEPLSEADESAPQLVRYVGRHEVMRLSIHTAVFAVDQWLIRGAEVDEDRFEFLCLTPVEHK